MDEAESIFGDITAREDGHIQIIPSSLDIV